MPKSTELAANIADVAEQYANAVEWLEACPFVSNQASDHMYEACQPIFEGMTERMNQWAHELNNPLLIVAIGNATTDSNWGDFDEEPAFWRYIANWAKSLK